MLGGSEPSEVNKTDTDGSLELDMKSTGKETSNVQIMIK